jgi:uncharacterized protein
MPQRLQIILVFLLTLTVGNPVFSADFQKGLDAHKRGDDETAISEWTPLAEQGDVRAQYRLGMFYSYYSQMSDFLGLGELYPYGTGYKWIKRAAEQGHFPAQNRLGRLYLHGWDVKKDKVYAHMWLNLAAYNGNKDAQKNRDFVMVAGQMTPSQIVTAQQLARECVQKKYRGC